MSTPEKIAEELKKDLHDAANKLRSGSAAVKRLEHKIYKQLEEIAELINIKFRHAFGRQNSQALLASLGAVIEHKINILKHLSKILGKSEFKELKQSSQALYQLEENLVTFKNKLLVRVEFKTADMALAYFQNNIIKSFREQLIPPLEKERRDIGESLKWEYA